MGNTCTVAISMGRGLLLSKIRTATLRERLQSTAPLLLPLKVSSREQRMKVGSRGWRESSTVADGEKVQEQRWLSSAGLRSLMVWVLSKGQ